VTRTTDFVVELMTCEVPGPRAQESGDSSPRRWVGYTDDRSSSSLVPCASLSRLRLTLV